MKARFTILVLFPFSVFGQSATFKEIKRYANKEFFNPQERQETIFYPVVITKDSSVSRIINDRIKNQVLGLSSGQSITKALKEEISEGLTDVAYEVTFNRNALLSINIFTQESGGNHLADNTYYFNFDLKDGSQLKLSKIFLESKVDSLKHQLTSCRFDSLIKYKEDVQMLLRRGDIDSNAYDLVMEQLKGNSFGAELFENFKINNSDIEFIENFGFPRIIRYLEPTYLLKFKNNSLDFFLKPEFRGRLK